MEKLLKSHDDLFHGIGEMMDVQVKLHINVKPVLADSSACSVHLKRKKLR